MQDKKESEDLKDRLAYEPEEVKRMVEEYNRQKQIEFEDLHSEKTCKIISVFNVFQNILLIAWLISFIISIVELYMHYTLTNHSIRFGRDRRILTPIIMPVAVMMGEYIGGLSKIGGTVFTTLGGAFALWITKEYILLYPNMQISTWLTAFFIIMAYICCIIMNFQPSINRYLKRYPSKLWFDPARDKRKKKK